MLDYRLDTFLSVCDTMNYHRSAELLHISQPAVTQHIRYLERVYDCRLFEYENRRLRKTEAARILERYARAQRSSEETMLRRIHNRDVRKLSVGATKTIGECIISPDVERFIRREENELSLIVDNTEHLLKLIDECRLDFALIEGYFDKNRYDSMLLSREPFVGICAAEHPFAGREIPPETLAGETVILREEGSGTRAILENRLRELGESLAVFRRQIVISSFPLICDYVRKGIGISFVYEVLAKQEKLATFTLAPGGIQREFHFVYRRHSGMEEKIRMFHPMEKREPEEIDR